MVFSMIVQVLLAILQGATEFLPISSSGHLALVADLVSNSDIAFFVMLHLGSLVAVLFFTRNEIWELLHFRKEDRKMIWFLILATIPAAIIGLTLNKFVEAQFSSLLFLGFAFIFTGFVLFFTRFSVEKSEMNWWRAILVGIGQGIAVFPGVSRSGMSISSARFLGIERRKAMRFSFLLFIPVVLGAALLEFKKGDFNFSYSLIVPLLVSAISSFAFMNVLKKVIDVDKFWMFSFYCWLVGIVTIILYVLGF